MSRRETVLQKVRAAIMAALTLTDDQVIPADDRGPRPGLPYLTVKILAAPRTGEVEFIRGVDGADDPIEWGEAGHIAEVSVQGFGEGAVDWLETLPLRVHRETVIAAAAPVSIRALPGGVQDLSTVLDTGFEPRAVLTLSASYYAMDDPDTLIEAATVGLESPSDPPLEATIDLDAA